MFLVERLNLPDPSPELIRQFRDAAAQVYLDPDNKRWLDEFYDNQINSALHRFCPLPELDQALRDQYQTYFPKHRIDCWAGIMRPANNEPACLPPHVDRGRTLAINYVVDHGGDLVSTLLYDQILDVTDQSTNLRYDQVQVVEHHVLGQGWMAYNVNRCHSVERIQGTRLIMIIRLDTPNKDYDLDHLRQDYADLFAVVQTKLNTPATPGGSDVGFLIDA